MAAAAATGVSSFQFELQRVRQALGKHVDSDLLDAWAEEEARKHKQGGNRFSGDSISKVCYRKFLYSDLRLSGKKKKNENENAGHEKFLVREEPVSSTARGVLRGLHVIQVNEMYNCAAPSKHRFEDAGRNRCMKMHCTDGEQAFVAIEFQFVPSLKFDAPAGTKLLVKDAPIRKGSLLLSPQFVQVLGGEVAPLEEANQRKIRNWKEVVSGELGIKREQRVDTIEKLHTITTKAALGSIGGSGDAELAEIATTGTNPSRENASFVDRTEQRVHRPTFNRRLSSNQSVPPPRSPQAAAAAGVEDDVVVVESEQQPDARTQSRYDTQPTTMEDALIIDEVPCATRELDTQLQTMSPSLPTRTPAVVNTPGSTFTSASKDNPIASPFNSFQLPMYAEEAANEMAERGTNDIEIKESKETPENPVFLDCQAQDGAAETQEMTPTPMDDDDAINLVSNSESSDINVQSDPNCDYYMSTRSDFSHLADIGSLEARSKVTVFCTIHDLVGVKIEDGEYKVRSLIFPPFLSKTKTNFHFPLRSFLPS